MSVHDLEDDELYKQLKDADLASRFLESEIGKVIRKACDLVVDRTIYEIANAPMDVFLKVENQLAWRTSLKMYKYDLFGAIHGLIDNGFLVYQELKTRHPEPLNQESVNSPQKGEQDGMA